MGEVGARGGARGLRVVGESESGPEDLVGEYLATLGGRSSSTVDAYGRVLHSLAGWVSERPGGSGGFRPELFTRTAVDAYGRPKFAEKAAGEVQRTHILSTSVNRRG